MRGRVIILLVLVVVVAVVAVAAILLAGQDDSTTTDADATDEPVAVTDGGEPSDGQPPDGDAEEDDGPTAPIETIDLLPVVIAVQDLPRGFRLTSDFFPENTNSPAVDIAFWPADSIPDNAITDIADVEDQLVRTDIAIESPILRTQLVADLTALGRVGSDAALLLPPGTVAVSMPLDPSGVGSVAYGIQHGDFVDVILSFLFIDVDETFQTRQPNAISIITRAEDGQLLFGDEKVGNPEPSTLSSLGVLVIPSEEQRPRLVTQRTIEQAFVVHVGYFPPDGRIVGVMSPTPFATVTPDPETAGTPSAVSTAPPQATPFLPAIITLGVEPQDALVLTWAIDAQIPVTFALRSATQGTRQPTTSVTLQYLIDTYTITQPERLPFALEPAIRSLRVVQLEVLREFGFDEFGNPILVTPDETNDGN